MYVVCVPACGYRCCTCLCACRDQRSTSGISSIFSTLALRQGLSLNMELTRLARLASELPGSFCVCLPSAGIAGAHALHVDSGNPNSDPHACKASAFPGKPFPQPASVLFSLEIVNQKQLFISPILFPRCLISTSEFS